MGKWLQQTLVFLLISASLEYSVDEEIADNIKEEGYVSDFPDYEPQTQAIPTEGSASDNDSMPKPLSTSESAVEGFDDYMNVLEDKVNSDDKISTDDDKVVLNQEAVSIDADTTDGGSDDVLPTSESVQDSFEDYIEDLEMESKEQADETTDADPDTLVSDITNTDVDDKVEDHSTSSDSADDAFLDISEIQDDSETGDEVDQSTTSESIEDGFQEYISDLDAEGKEMEDAQTDNQPEEQSATSESVEDGFQEYISDLDAEGKEMEEAQNEDQVEDQSATSESVEDGLQEYISELDSEGKEKEEAQTEDQVEDQSATSKSASDGLEEYSDGVEEEIDDSLDRELDEIETPSNTTDLYGNILVPENRIQENTEQKEPESEPIEELSHEDQEELGDAYVKDGRGSLEEFDVPEESESEPIDDELLDELEELSHEEELVDAYVKDGKGSLDEFDVPEDSDSKEMDTVYSDTPYDTDTQSVTDSHQSGYQIDGHDNSYDRESIQYVPYQPEVNIDKSSNAEADMQDSSQVFENPEVTSYQPSGYGHDSYTDAPAYPDGYFKEHELEDEIKQFEVEIPGHVDQGDFYNEEYKNFLAEEKNSMGDEGLTSYHTIAYFILIVLISLIIYIGYTSRHRLFKSNKSNYSYSRLGEQQFTPLV